MDGGYRTTSSIKCDSEKIFYREAWQAQLALIRLAMEAKPGEKIPRSYYPCSCRYYHLTSADNGLKVDDRKI